MYLEVASQIVGAGQSALCLCSQYGGVSHMTHTDEEGSCCSGPGSLDGGKPVEKTDRHMSRTGYKRSYKSTEGIR